MSGLCIFINRISGQLKHKLMKNMLKRVRSTAGVTLAELLAAMLILGLVSSGMTVGVRFAVDKYNQIMRDTEAEVLYSTLSTVISNELRYTTRADDEDGDGYVDTFFSHSFASKSEYARFSVCDDDGNIMTDDGAYGQICIGQSTPKRILAAAAYNRNLRARVQSVKYNSTDRIFTVTLSIANGQEEMFTQSFDVISLNIDKKDTASTEP